MASQTDVRATRLAASGQVTPAGQRTRLKAIHWVGGVTAGTLDFKDGTTAGTSQFIIDTPAGVATSGSLLFPGEGVLFEIDCYVTITNTAFVTAFWA